MRVLFVILRIIAGGGIIAAIVGQLAFSLDYGVPNVPHFLVNFFSFFTILSNAMAAIVLLAGAWFGLRPASTPSWYTLVRGSVTTYMVTTGVVYNLLLRGISLDQATTLPWSNEVLHLFAPIYLLLDWLLAPGRERIAWQRFATILAFPAAWLVYTLIRGPIVGWYPYPFLNPAQPGGYGAVLIYCVAIAGFIGVMGVGVVAVSRTRQLLVPSSSPALP
ncbi:Pr6Pr family membrane protein [Naasia lichenicola]|uniref:Pr6Pr family membrane protein n=1 Tax=Naasia lichenicola TaxID=2565933 RepID=A0A4V3WT82_9MICO|nr:Pr6Pr family membrane protein [Naasia lichenicola]THG30967.1 hypothetical protein E6C64_10175 [Naasia lichenicola]